MTEKEIIRTSKFLSLVLRHEPERVGLKLGEAGWVGVDPAPTPTDSINYESTYLG